MRVTVSDSAKPQAYVALRALDRALAFLRKESVDVPKELESFLDRAWGWLGSDPIKLNARGINREINKATVDEQDAGHVEQLRNHFLYALADLLLYFTGGSAESLKAVLDSVEELHYYAADHRLMSSGLNDSTVYTDAVQNAIESDVQLVGERASIAKDDQTARGISDWRVAVTDRFK